MNRPWLVAWPFLLLLCQLCGCWNASFGLTVYEDRASLNLRVSIRKSSLVGVPSCQHTFSQIELQNLHSTEAILIHSITTTPEETVLVESELGGQVGQRWAEQALPQQLHVSQLPSGSLTLGPGQVAIVPITFLPRYPEWDVMGDQRGNQDDDDDDNYGDNNLLDDSDQFYRNGKSPPPLSSTARLDLIDLVGERVLKVIENSNSFYHTNNNHHNIKNRSDDYLRSSNLDPSNLPKGDKYEVTTTVWVSTSKGDMDLAITASSVRENPYGIPDVIKVRHPQLAKAGYKADCSNAGQHGAGDFATVSSDGVVIMDIVHAHDDREFLRGEMPTERDCYDLYISNPFPDKDLQIKEALVSRPEVMSLQLDPPQTVTSRTSLLHTLDSSSRKQRSQVIRQWTPAGPLSVPPDSEKHYALTLCTASEGEVTRDEASEFYLNEMSKWIDAGNPNRDLGFLQIRTDVHTLFVAIEHDEMARFFSVRNESLAGLEASNGTRQHSAPDSPTPSSRVGVSANGGTTRNRLLKSRPDQLFFEMMSTTSPMMQAKVSLLNKSPVPIRIMRVSVGMDTFGDKAKIQEAQQIGLKLNVSVVSDGRVDYMHDKLDGLVLASATSVDDVLVLSCSLNPDGSFTDSNKESFQFNGTMIVRGTMDTELTYQEWRDETLRNPFRDEHLTLELPFSVSVLNGRFEALIVRSTHPYPQLFASLPWDRSGRAVSYLFFPMTQFQAKEGSEGVLPAQNFIGSTEIRHDLRVLSNMLFPVAIESAEIIDASENANKLESLCGRFNVSIVPPYEMGTMYQGFEEIGSLSLRYRFGPTQGGEYQKDPLLSTPNIPKSCSLIVKTRPEEAGIFRIPLMIFTSHLDVATTDPNAGTSHIRNHTKTNIRMGYSYLSSWSRSTRVGQSFLEFLSKTSGERRKNKNDSLLLSNYVSQFSRRLSTQSKPKFIPIMLDIGTIDHGEIAKIPLYFTNINPVPISLSIDVGEVEGSMIVLARDPSQTRGDGNSLVDHLPKEGSPRIVPKGRFKGHPIGGLLQFLTSNDKTLEFVSEYSFRDAVSLNKGAVEAYPVLQSLYDWHSHANFHRTQLPSRMTCKKTSLCDEKKHPPSYRSFNETYARDVFEGMQGALLLSGDKILSRQLNQYWERDMKSDPASYGTTVQIPPGGTARFEIHQRAPPKDYLENDISQLLATGLVLSTNLGDVMPIFAMFEALQGQLHASHVQPFPRRRGGLENGPQEEQHMNTTVIKVPLEFLWSSKSLAKDSRVTGSLNSSTTRGDPGNASNHVASDVGVPLFLKSSFSRQVRLLNIESCNPWFQFVPLSSGEKLQPNAKDGVKVGYLRTAVDCSQSSLALIEFPSYYQCIFNWLLNRPKLQPEGCGQRLIQDSSINLRKLESVRKSVEYALRVLKKTYAHSTSVNFNHSGLSTIDFGHLKTRDGRRRDGFISNLESFSVVWKALKVASAYGFDCFSSSLRATVEYHAMSSDFEGETNDAIKQNLSLSIRDLEVQSILEPPRLFDPAGLSKLDFSSNVLEFSATPVASVAKAVISLRNPTGTAVRIRLGAITHAEDIPDSSTGQFFGLPLPYVQNGNSSFAANDTLERLWWDGDGAYFLSDNHGDVIRSHHNLTIKAGPGAFVSLVNPSLHAQVAFLVGCGARCGIRDETQTLMDIAYPMFNSPIGASAAAGISLSGIKRSGSPQLNALVGPEPCIFAGGALVRNTGGPAAFAIPYAALDEIIIPPYGRGELGPIFFRPPGRYGVIGCNVAKESGARLRGEKKELCNQHEFESVVYLENTLTGLEKLVLRGRSMWDRVFFVDPPPRDGEDSFGDIEFRNGRPTLLFSGTSVASTDPARASLAGERSRRQSVVKEVVLQNGGDAPVEISLVYLSSVGRGGDGGGRQKLCNHGTFRLLECWDSEIMKRDPESTSAENILPGLRLEAGERRSFFVEHIPDCSRKEEFVSLIVQMKQGDSSNLSSEKHVGPSFPGERRSLRSHLHPNPFARTEASLILGYQMGDADFARCVPVNNRLLGRGVLHRVKLAGRPSNASNLATNNGYAVSKKSASLILEVILFSTAALLLCYALRARFNAMWSVLLKMPMYLVNRGRQKGLLARKLRSHWNAAFRCLARADPASTELQTMSREQMRQVILGQYKAKGTTPPAAVSGNTAFTRERRNSSFSALRQRTGKENANGNERIRTLSEAIFHDTSIANGLSLRKSLPVGLGWRTAYTRGILKDNSIASSKLELRTRALRQRLSSKSFEQASQDTDESDHEVEDEENDTTISPSEEEDYVSTTRKSDQLADVEYYKDPDGVVTLEPLSVIATFESERVDQDKLHVVKTQDVEMEENRLNLGPSGSTHTSARPFVISGSTHDEITPGWKIESNAGNQSERVPNKESGSDVANDDTNDEEGRGSKAASQSLETIVRHCDNNSGNAPKNPFADDKFKEEVAQKNRPLQKVSNQTSGKGDRQKAAVKTHGQEEGKAEKKPRNNRAKGNSRGKQSPSANKTQDQHRKVEDEKTHSVELLTNASLDPILRLPPGLSPPPGFGGSQTTFPANSSPKLSISTDSLDKREHSLESMLHSALSNADIELPLTDSRSDVTLPFIQRAAGGSDLFFTRSIGGGLGSAAAGTGDDAFAFPGSQSPRLCGLGTVSPSCQGGDTRAKADSELTIPVLLTAVDNNQDGFDVMDFLDSILNEGAPLVEAEKSEVNASIAAGVGLSNSAAPVLDNPWATEGRSRAAAYGISFDEDDDNSSNASPIFNVLLEGNSVDEGPTGLRNIPLLTPAAILNAEQDEDVDEGDIVVSFYAGLVDE